LLCRDFYPSENWHLARPLQNRISVANTLAAEAAKLKRWRSRHCPINAKESIMNWDQVKGNWKQFKGRAQQQWGKLTEDDLDVVDGKREELVGRIQERYGCAKEKAEEEVDEFCGSCK
jgi:uncharacterized protein YjbJ (UPF0337 family)